MKPSKATETPSSDQRTTVPMGDTHAQQALPAERDQAAGAQSPAAGQDSTAQARTAHKDAERARPDTSSAPQLQDSPDSAPPT